MAKKRGTPRRRVKKPVPPRKRSTALVRQPAAPVRTVQAEPVPERILTAGTHLGELGLVPIKFTDAEERILSEPPPEHRLRVKPDGAVYLPHADYTRWFNRAFNRGGWALVPVGLAGLVNKTVVCPYVLYIHGKPAAFAQGEQEYLESNKNQSYGDALESTVASALRRCSKRLGVGLELWDRDYTDAWRRLHCVKVWVTDRDGKSKPAWRLSTDPPLPYEGKGRGQPGPGEDFEDPGGAEPARERRPPPRASQAPPAGYSHGASDEVITPKMRQRLVTIIQNSGRIEREVVGWLERNYQSEGTKGIRRKDYDAVCSAIESPADLPERRR